MPLPGEDAYGLDGHLDAPPMESVGHDPDRGLYACLDCDHLRHATALEAFDHHRATRHHRIGFSGAPERGPIPFSCCHELAGAVAPVEEPETEVTL